VSGGFSLQLDTRCRGKLLEGGIMGRQSEIGLAGERECAHQLGLRGWAVSDFNASRANFPNVDLLIEKYSRQLCIQVKASRRTKGYITGGGVNPGVINDGPIFNRVPGGRICDHVIFLASNDQAWRYFIMPVKSAEMVFRKNIDAYFKSPRLDGHAKAQSGQADIFVGSGHFPHSRIVPDQRDEIPPFENRWDLLE
jgi:hypothetical protein